MPNDRVIPTVAATDNVTFTIRGDGQALDRTIHCLSVSVCKEVGRIASAKIVVVDGDPANETFEVSNGSFFAPGTTIEILAGYHTQEELIFRGIVIRQNLRMRSTGSSLLIVDCKDACFRLALSEQCRHFTDSTDSDAIEQIVADYSISSDIASSDVIHRNIVQHGCTDWDFIIARAESCGMISITSDGTLTIRAPIDNPNPVLTVRYGATLLELDMALDGRTQSTTTVGRGWSSAEQDIIETEANEPDLRQQGNSGASDLAEQLECPADLQLDSGGFINEEQLQQRTNARLLRQRLARIRGRVRFQGTHVVQPGVVISIEGIGERMSGDAFVSGVTHTIANGQWTCDAQLGLDREWFTRRVGDSRPGILPHTLPLSGIHIGIVTQLEGDPDSEERIKVKLPLTGEGDEGIWSRLACMDAGGDRGCFFRPEIGDEVALGFLNDDPDRPVVLGAFHSSSNRSPEPLSDDNHKKGYVSRSGIRITIDDELPSLTIETKKGKCITVDDDADEIVVKDKPGNTFTMNSDGISLESAKDLALSAKGSIKIEGMSIESKAKTSLKLEGSTTAEFVTNGTSTIRGTMVNIN